MEEAKYVGINTSLFENSEIFFRSFGGLDSIPSMLSRPHSSNKR